MGVSIAQSLVQAVSSVVVVVLLASPVGETPMTYRTKSGKQFVVVPTGVGEGAEMAAFSLRGQADQ